MNDIDSMIENILSESPAVVDQNAKRPITQTEITPSPAQTELPAENIRRKDPLRTEQVNPLDDSALVNNNSIFKSDGQSNLYGVQGARRPTDMSRGDPFFLDPVERYQEVAPFDLYLPALGKLAKLATTQPDKAAWGIVRAEGMLPEYDYLGYYRMREGPAETRTGAFFKNFAAGMNKIITSPARLMSFMYEAGANQTYDDLTNASEKKARAKEFVSKSESDKAMVGAATKALFESAANDPIISPQVKRIKDWWDSKYEAIDSYWGLDPELEQTFGTAMWGGAGNGLASLAALYLAPLPAAVSIGLMNTGLSAPNIYYGAIERAGITPEAAFQRAVGGAALISGLDAVPLLGTTLLRGAKRSAIGEILTKYKAAKAKNPALTIKDWATAYAHSRALYMTPVRMAGEMGTETLQGVTEDFLSGALQTQQDWEQSLDTRVIEAFGAGISMAAVFLPEYRTAPREMHAEIFRNFVKSDAFVTYQNRLLEMMKPVIEDGILTTDDVKGLALLAASPATHEFIDERMRMAVDGAIDKATPEDIENFKQTALKMKEQGKLVNAETLNELDTKVAKAVTAGGFEEADVPLFQGLFRGLAAIKAYARGDVVTDSDIGEFFSVDKISARRGREDVGVYEPDTNTLRIKKSQRSGSRSAYDNVVVGAVAESNTLAERTKTILHEMSHKIDRLTGQVGLGNFLADSFEAVSEIFGNEIGAKVRAGARGSAVKGTSKDAQYTKFTNTTEWKAQAIERLGKAAAKYLGLQGSKAQLFLSYLNLVTRGAEDVGLATEGIEEYNNVMSELMKSNSDSFIQILNSYGQTQLANKIREFVNGNYSSPEDVGISFEDAQNIAKALKGFMDETGISAVKSVMDLDTMQSFIDKTNALFEQGIEQTNAESERLADEGKELHQESLDGPVSVEELIGGREELLTDDQLLSKEVEVPESEDILAKEPLMPKQEPTSSPKPETFTEWYTNNHIEQKSNKIQEAIKASNAKKIRFPKLAKWWGKLVAGDTLLTMDWLGGRAFLDEFGILDAERKWNNVRFAVQEDTQKMLDKRMGFNAVTREQFYNRMATGFVDIVEADGKKRTLNGFEMMDVYLNDQQPYSKKRNALAFQNGQAGVDEVIKAMTPEMKQYAEILREKLASLRTKYEKALGIKFKDWENYWPVADKYGQVFSNNRIYSYYERNEEAQGPLGIRDARDKFNQYVNKYAMAESGYYKQVQLLKAVFTGIPDKVDRILPQENHLFNKFNAEKYKNNALLQDALGEDGARRFLEGIESLLKAPAADLPVFTQGVVGKAINAATVSRLVWTPISLAKNAMNIFLGAGADPDGAQSYWRGLGAALSNPVDAWNFMMQFPTIRNRFKGITVDEFLQSSNVSSGLLTELGNTINGGKASAAKILAGLSGLFKVANKTGMSFMLLGDALSNVFGLYGYAQKLMSQTGGNIDMVDSALNEYIANTQSTTLRSIKSNFHRTILSMPIVGNLGALSAEGVIKFKNIGQNIAQAIVGEKTFGEASKKILPIVMSTIGFIMLSVGIGDLWDDNEDNDKDVYDGLVNQSLQELLSFNVLGNNVLAPIVGHLFGVRNQGINTPFTTQVAKLFTDINKGDVYDASLQTATMFGGLYIDRFANTISGVRQALTGETQQEVNVGIRRALGRPEAFAERREGVKKKKE